LIFSAIAFGVAVSGMHYTAMAGVTLFPHVAAPIGAPALSTDLLAIVVAIVAFCVSAIFLLILVPDRTRPSSDALPDAINLSATIWAQPVAATQPETVPGGEDDPELGRGTYAPLGGLGAPPRRFARHLPFERNGATHFLAVDDVVAIHASAHYTYIFDGSAKLFCPLAIGEVESRLDSDRFLRIHRSHIINIDRVIGCKRSGDGDIVELDAAEHYVVPVSRSRVGRVKSRITSKIAVAK
jgi:DNA-binding LytR/AlgR family response regulator